jgi:RHS repeat-associated protein
MDASAGQCHFYSDGQIADTDEFVSGTTVFSTGAGLNNLYIGGLDGGQYLNADIDEVRIYTAARTQAEIQADMNTPIGGAPPGDTTPPVISGVSAGSIGATSATINWTTNENSDSQVEYGTTTAYGQSTTLNPSLVTAHSQGLSGLTAGTLYHYRVKSKDGAGNLALSGDFTFTTATAGDVTPPVITGVSSSAVTQNAATITWTTNEPADSQVEYGLTIAYGQSTTLNPALVTAHSQGLSGLTPGTLYHYRVKSKDAAGNLRVSGDFTFTTAQSPSIPLDGLANLSYNTTNNWISTTGFEYHPDGTQIRAVIDASGTQQQSRYDCAGRLSQVLDGNGAELARYSYGASNQRLMSVEGGLTTYYAWAEGQIIAEYEASGTNGLRWKMSYVHMGGRLLATEQTDGIRYHHPDRLGTSLTTDASDGVVISERLTMPFGTQLPYGSTLGGDNSWQHPGRSNLSKKWFTSYDRSAATGSDYALNRYYSSQQGRFTQVDPMEMNAASLGNPQSLNMYSYVQNDPVSHLDPRGTDALEADCFWVGTTVINDRIYNKYACFIGEGMGGGGVRLDGGDDQNGGGSSGGGQTRDEKLEKIQIALDIIGLCPGLGEIADAGSAYISYERGDKVGMWISIGAMVPIGGWIAAAFKWGRRGKRLLKGEGAVGTYGDLIDQGSKFDDITPHHIPSAKHMEVKYGVKRDDGIAINMEQPNKGGGGRHRRTWTYGNSADVKMSTRDATAAGVRDLRKIYMNDGLYGPYMRKQLLELIKQLKNCQPQGMKKEVKK